MHISSLTMEFCRTLTVGAIVESSTGSEQFIQCFIGRTPYWINLRYGFEYTRAQLDKKYGATFKVIRTGGEQS